ncbi:HDOD domain-containing protein [Methylibium sp.]|uniref:HDOD domain-containing protein n=1 Tax=Methylibium sp. TaxID=2067992 RepID=UPI003D0DEE90
MSIDSSLRALDIDLPACPQILVQLSMLMHDEDANLQSIAGLIETDMALASAVVRSVNSALFGLLRRVESVPEAVRYLGTREVSALTFEIGLRGAFPPSPLLTALWARAGRRGLAMGRAAPSLDIDPWLAHTVGLFAESGQAALVAHDAPGYEALVAATSDSLAQLDAEVAAYGLNHAALGAALCRAWGLAGDVAAGVRLRPMALRSLVAPQGDDFAAPWLTEPLSVQRLLALGAVVDAALEGSGDDMLARAATVLGPLAGIDAALLHEAVAASVARLGD